jgi:hypothetical protein
MVKKEKSSTMMEITRETIIKYAKEYDEHFEGTNDELVEKETKNWLKHNRYLTRDKFIKVGIWKSPRPKKRYESNRDSLVEEITRFSLATQCEEAKVKSLLILSGVGYPLASVILHFASPGRYPIMDFRVIESLGWQEQPKDYNFDFWQKYCKKIRDIAEETGKDIRTIDKALWEYSKREQNEK